MLLEKPLFINKIKSYKTEHVDVFPIDQDHNVDQDGLCPEEEPDELRRYHQHKHCVLKHVNLFLDQRKVLIGHVDETNVGYDQLDNEALNLLPC